MASVATAPFAVETMLGVAEMSVVTTTTLGVSVVEADVDGAGELGVIDGETVVTLVLEFVTEPAETEEVVEEDPLAKEPIPHGIFSPSGWVDSVGGTMSFAESVIVKRPVQVLSEVDGDVNW